MNLRRLSLAAALSAGVCTIAWSQAPPPKDPPPKDPPAATPPATPPAAPAASKPNPAIKQALDEVVAGKLDEAITILKKAGETDKLLEPPLIILSGFFYNAAAQGGNQNQLQSARQLLERAGAEDPTHPDAYILSGSYALNEGRFLDAMVCFDKALYYAGDTRFLTEQRVRFVKSARAGLAQAYSKRGEFGKALDQLKALLAEDQKNAVIRSEVAKLTFLLNQPEAAYEDLKRAFADDGKNPQVGLPEVSMATLWNTRPYAKDKEVIEEPKNKAQADEWFKKALAAYPKDIRAPREYGRWLLNQNRIADADKQFADAKAIDPADSETRALIGLSFRYKKQYAEAEKIFDELNRTNPDIPAYAWNLALSLAESNKDDAKKRGLAIASVTQQSQPRSPEASSVLGWCLFKLDRLDDADQAIGNALKVGNNSASPDTIYFLARILEKRGKGTDARDKLKQALESKGPFVYRKDAEVLYDELVKKHGAVPPPEPKKDAPKPETPPKPPETPPKP